MLRVVITLAMFLVLSARSWCVGDVFGTGENFFEIRFREIGDPGNLPDTDGNPAPAGAVDYVYQMGRYEVSRDMVDKANAEAGLGLSLDTMEFVLGGPRPDMPATGVSWNEAARFVNWLNTSKGIPAAYRFPSEPGDLDYDPNENILLWQPSDLGYSASNPYRNNQARYFLPSVHEWYKAAFFHNRQADGSRRPGYWPYPTGGVPKSRAVPRTHTHAAYDEPLEQGPADIYSAGSGQAGNVWEWEETDFDLTNDGSLRRGLRGGAWDTPASQLISLSSSGRSSGTADGVDPMGYNVGFRVASLPGPDPLGVFDDGGHHTITELEKLTDAIFVSNQTTVTHQGLIQSFVEFTTSRPDAAVSVQQSQFNLAGGRVEPQNVYLENAIHAVESEMWISDGTIDFYRNDDVGGIGRTVNLTNSTLRLTGGMIRDRADIHSFGVTLRGDSVVDMSGGLVSADSAFHACGFELEDNSRLDVSGGTVTSRGEGGIGICLSGQAHARFSGGGVVATAQDSSAEAVTLKDHAAFVMTGGQLEAVGVLNHVNGVSLTGAATAEIQSGRLKLLALFNHSVSMFVANGNSELTVRGGEFEIGAVSERLDAIPILLDGRQDARITVSGGTFLYDGEDFIGIRAADESEVSVIGSEFNYPLFEPILDTEGVLTGRLADGSEFHWPFQRDENATIMLVPEPYGNMMFVLLMTSLVYASRRSG